MSREAGKRGRRVLPARKIKVGHKNDTPRGTSPEASFGATALSALDRAEEDIEAGESDGSGIVAAVGEREHHRDERGSANPGEGEAVGEG